MEHLANTAAGRSGRRGNDRVLEDILAADRPQAPVTRDVASGYIRQ